VCTTDGVIKTTFFNQAQIKKLAKAESYFRSISHSHAVLQLRSTNSKSLNNYVTDTACNTTRQFLDFDELILVASVGEVWEGTGRPHLKESEKRLLK